jgi:hypothetical protein
VARVRWNCLLGFSKRSDYKPPETRRASRRNSSQGIGELRKGRSQTKPTGHETEPEKTGKDSKPKPGENFHGIQSCAGIKSMMRNFIPDRAIGQYLFRPNAGIERPAPTPRNLKTPRRFVARVRSNTLLGSKTHYKQCLETQRNLPKRLRPTSLRNHNRTTPRQFHPALRCNPCHREYDTPLPGLTKELHYYTA